MPLNNESKIVFNELLFVFRNQNKFKKIQLINYPGLSDDNKYLGENIKISFVNYENEFYKISSEKKVSIVLDDDSIINLNYVFDNEGNIVEHHLCFLPNPLESEVSIEEIESKYIRIDYEHIGYTPKVHSYVHFHIGKYKNLRLPCSSIISPIQFISFIFLFYYNTEYKEFSIFLKKENIRNALTSNESGTFIIDFLKKDD